MKLDKVRHFIFVNDKKTFESKKNMVIFRGKVKGKTSRKKFLATERKFMTDPIGYMQANSNIRITVRNEDGTPREGADLLREYNPLETE